MYKYSVNVKNVDKEYHKSVFCAFDILLKRKIHIISSEIIPCTLHKFFVLRSFYVSLLVFFPFSSFMGPRHIIL